MGSAFAILGTALVIGLAARFALPGPDPMPFWLTVVIGLSGALIGGGASTTLFWSTETYSTSLRVFVTLLLQIAAAVGVLALYRILVQRRSLYGPAAYRFPTRGVGIARLRQQLKALGHDPDALGRAVPDVVDTPHADADELLRMRSSLRERFERGEIDEEEYEQTMEQLRRY